MLVNPNNTDTTAPELRADTGGQLVYSGTLQGPAHLTGGGVHVVQGFLAGNIIDDSTLDVVASQALSYGGNTSGSGSLIKDGSGCLTVTGSNTYTGGTTINAGTLQVGNGGAPSGSGEFLGSPSITLASGAALVFNQSDSLTYGGLITGSGGLSKTGGGTLTLSASNNNYSGGTTLAGGELSVSASGSLARPAAPSSSTAGPCRSPERPLLA